MKFQKELQIKLADYIEFNFFHNKTRLVLTFTLFVLLTPWFCYIIIDTSLSFGMMILICYLSAIFVTALMMISSYFSIKRTSKKQFASSKAMQIPSLLSIDSSEISQQNSIGSIRYSWSDIYRASESKTSFYIYCSKFQAMLIPKRLLTEQEEETIRSLINDNIDPKKNKLKKH